MGNSTISGARFDYADGHHDVWCEVCGRLDLKVGIDEAQSVFDQHVAEKHASEETV